MIKITYVTADGTERPVEVEPGMSIMAAAVLEGVNGIVGECGGGCSCATCHVYVDDMWGDSFEQPAPEEEGLLEFLDDAKPNSRLSCQLLLEARHNGLCVRTPPSQG